MSTVERRATRPQRAATQANKRRMLDLLATGPMTAERIAKRLGLTLNQAGYVIKLLEDEYLIHSRLTDGPGARRQYILGPETEAETDNRDYAVLRTELPDGRVRVSFGSRHKPGRGQRRPGHQGGCACSLWSVYQ